MALKDLKSDLSKFRMPKKDPLESKERVTVNKNLNKTPLSSMVESAPKIPRSQTTTNKEGVNPKNMDNTSKFLGETTPTPSNNSEKFLGEATPTPSNNSEKFLGETTPTNSDNTSKFLGETSPTKFDNQSNFLGETTPTKFDNQSNFLGETTPSKFDNKQSFLGETTPSKFDNKQSFLGETNPIQFDNNENFLGLTTPTLSNRESKFLGETTPNSADNTSKFLGETTQTPSNNTSKFLGETTPAETDNTSKFLGETTPNSADNTSKFLGETTQTPSNNTSKFLGETTQAPSNNTSKFLGETTSKDVNYITDIHAKGFTSNQKHKSPSKFIGVSKSQLEWNNNSIHGKLKAVNFFPIETSKAQGFSLNQKHKSPSKFIGVSKDQAKFSIDSSEYSNYSSYIHEDLSTAPGYGKFKLTKSASGQTQRYNPTKSYYSEDSKLSNKSISKLQEMRNSPSFLDEMYSKFNLRDDAHNTGMTAFDHPLILRGIQRRGKRGTEPQNFGIPGTSIDLDDGLIRGGIITSTTRAVIDVIRLGKWMVSIKGLLWGVKQFGLQQSNPNVEKLGGIRRTKMWTPINTLASALGQHIGFHPNRHGFTPFDKNDGGYESVQRSKRAGHTFGQIPLTSRIGGNRLVGLWSDSFFTVGDSTSSSTFKGFPFSRLLGIGGPNSVYGLIPNGKVPTRNEDTRYDIFTGNTIQNQYGQYYSGNAPLSTKDNDILGPKQIVGSSQDLDENFRDKTELAKKYKEKDSLPKKISTFDNPSKTAAEKKANLNQKHTPLDPNTGEDNTYIGELPPTDEEANDFGLSATLNNKGEIVYSDASTNTFDNPSQTKNNAAASLDPNTSADNFVNSIDYNNIPEGSTTIITTTHTFGEANPVGTSHTFVNLKDLNETKAENIFVVKEKIGTDENPSKKAADEKAKFNQKYTLIEGNLDEANTYIDDFTRNYVDEAKDFGVTKAYKDNGNDYTGFKPLRIPTSDKNDGIDDITGNNAAGAVYASDYNYTDNREELEGIDLAITRDTLLEIDNHQKISITPNEIHTSYGNPFHGIKNTLGTPHDLNVNTTAGEIIQQYETIAYGNIPDRVAGLNKTIDFRSKLTGNELKRAEKEDYDNKNIETRLKFGTPGLVKLGENRVNWSNTDPAAEGFLERFDKVNASNVGDEEMYDLIHLWFKTTDKTRIQFRGTVAGITDTFSPSWDSVKYNGRADQAYQYKTFERSLSFNFKIYATSRIEMKPIYKKLAQLAKMTMPTYNGDPGYSGQLIEFRLGNLFDKRQAFIESLSYSMSDETPWDIALDDKIGEMPMGVDVSIGLKILGDKPTAGMANVYDTAF